MKNNTITGLLKQFIVVLSGLDVASTTDFSGNLITSQNYQVVANNTNSLIQANILSCLGAQVVTTVSIALLDIIAQVKDNVFISRDTEAAVIQIGTEGGAVSYNRMNGSIVSGNKSLCPRYFGNDPGGQHWMLNYAQTIEAKYNYVNGAFLGFVNKSGGGTNASIIRSNILVDTDNPLMSKGVKGVLYYNNTCVFKTLVPDGVGLMLLVDTDNAEDTVFKNNIIIDFRATADCELIQAAALDLAGCDIDYNIYYKAGNKTHFAKIGGAWKTFVEWQALGFDAHSIVLSDSQALNLFTNYLTGDYSLKAGSAAIGTGVDLGAAYDDCLDASTAWGADTALPAVVTKQQGASWDIGAYIH